MQRPTLLDFFVNILPNSGVYALALRNPATYKMTHKILYDIHSVYAGAANNLQGQSDLYFALASFKEGWHTIMTPKGESNVFRTQENVAKLRSLWLDIDVGENKDYKTQKEALAAFRDFVAFTKMPTPWLIESGSGGYHVYWTIDQDIDRDTWQDMADRLHAATRQFGLKVDASRTRDSASILRVPASLNHKTNPPNPVKLALWGKQVSLEYYQQVLSRFERETVDTTSMPTLTVTPLGFDVQAMMGGISANVITPIEASYQVRKAEDIVAGCPQLQQQNGAEEPIWRGMLATLRHCEGGVELAHKLSQQDPRYNYADTQNKLDQLEKKDIAPYTCDTFALMRPSVCMSCAYRGIIKSPISVPEQRIPVVEITDDGEVAPTQNEIPIIDTGLYRVTPAGCYMLAETKDTLGNPKSYWHKFYEYPVYPIQRIKDMDTAGGLNISYLFRKHGPRGYDDFQIGGDVLMGTGVSAFLGSVGFLLSDKDKKPMVGLLVNLLQNAESTIEETKVTNSLGWDDEGNFLLGNKVYKPNGDVVPVTPKGKAADASQNTVPKGSLEQWKKIANVYNRKGLEWAQVVVASAFASPLMPIGALERAALIFLTGDKGTGKSTALAVAMSVYGHYEKLRINKDDTAIARLMKLGILNNIAATFDEMTSLTPKEASELAYQITQGRGKDRSGDMGKHLQTNTTFWSCLPVMSANDSIVDSLSLFGFDSTAQMSRVLEVKSTDINEVYAAHELAPMQDILRTIPVNYGTAGDVYVQYLVTHYKEVEKLIKDVETLVVNELRLNSNFRFWTYMITRLLVGVMIANKLELVSYSVADLFAYLKSVVLQSLTKMQRYEYKTTNLLTDFLSAHIGERLDVASERRPKDKPDNPSLGALNDGEYVKHKPAIGRNLSIRVELEERRGYIRIRAAKDWCKLNSIPYDTFIQSITNSGLLVATSRSIGLGKGTEFRNVGRCDCIEFILPSSD